MKAVQLLAFGGAAHLAVVDLPEPSAGATEIVVRMRAASLNYRDLLNLDSQRPGNLPAPFIPLSDGAGEVVATGSEVKRFKRGDRVAGLFFQTWAGGPFQRAYHSAALGGSAPGILAEYVVLPEDGAIRLPDHLTFEQAATLPCAALTAWNALFEGNPILPGQTVLALGTGGVSMFALQFAKMAGAKVIITSSSEEKLGRAKALGADHVINYQTTPDWEKAVHQITQGRGADQIIEVGGAGTLGRSLRAAAHGGDISMIGVLTGMSGDLKTFDIVAKALRLRGIYVGSRAMFERMNKALGIERLQPVVDTVFPMAQTRAAFEHLKQARHFGKIVITI